MASVHCSQMLNNLLQIVLHITIHARIVQFRAHIEVLIACSSRLYTTRIAFRAAGTGSAISSPHRISSSITAILSKRNIC